jgi:hypothetical protein
MSRRVPPHAAGDHKRLDTVLAAGLVHTRGGLLKHTNPPPAPDVPDALRVYNLPGDTILQILSVPQSCKSLLKICSEIRAFSSICADENHPFWKAVLQRKGWMVDWPKSASGKVEEPGGLSPKRFYLMMCKMEEDEQQALTAVTSTTTSIPDKWMLWNTQLALTALPSGIKEIGVGAFRQCTSLAIRLLPPSLALIKHNAFEECTSLVLDAPEALPPGIMEIGHYAFQECTSLALQALPPNLTTIGYSAFERCTSLALKKLPPGLTIIEPWTFAECSSLALETLPPNLETIKVWAFTDCESLALGDFTELRPNLEIEEFAFSGCDHLVDTPFGEAVKAKQSRAFAREYARV